MKQYLEKRGIYITWSQLVMRIIFDLVGFLLALLPAGLTLYLTDVWITSGTHMPTSWILGIIVCVFLIHFYQFYFVNYNSQMNADRMAGNYRQHLAQKILSSSIPAYESQNKARIQNMANDVSAIYTVSSYLVTVPANLVKVIIIIGLLLFYASPSVALTAIISVSTKTEDLTATNQNQVIFSILTSFFQVQSEKTLFVDERFPIHSIKNLKLFFSCLPLTSR